MFGVSSQGMWAKSLNVLKNAKNEHDRLKADPNVITRSNETPLSRS